MASVTAERTLLQPQAGRQSSGAPSGPTHLHDDLLSQAASRLRAMALLYAVVFFLADVFPPLLFAEARARMFGSFSMWGPAAISIAVGLAVAITIGSGRVAPATTLTIGLIFEVASNYGIAASEFLGTLFERDVNWFGLSWVATWTMLFTVVVPTPPRRALVAALASVSAVPVMGYLGIRNSPLASELNAFGFFFGLIFPYLLVVAMAYVGARVVYSLGAEVTRARELGSYRLVERLGAGGMGEVWVARHRLLARPAAVKLIKPAAGRNGQGGVSVEAHRRFAREAQTIASLRSPHTVNLFDFGVASDGSFYYAMELLDGVDAETLVKRFGPAPVERVIHILQQVCHSLSEAESRGLVHRDIKPANIFLCRYGEDHDFVKVLDFGIVKATDNAGEDASQLTIELSVRGTPAFIAPEQALGEAHIDGRADIYATGCVAYWLLTGQHVFKAETAVGLLTHHARTPAPAPSLSTPAPIPDALDRLVLECLSKERAARPQSARELSRRLSAIACAQAWTEERARQWWAEHLPPQAAG